MKMGEGKPVIVILAHGTGEANAQKALENVDTQARKRFTGYELRWALASEALMKRLKASGQTTLFSREEPMQNLTDLYAELKAMGKMNVAVQLLLVVEGSESHRLLETPSIGLHVEYGQPLLKNLANIERLIQAITPEFGGEGDLTIVVGHGNEKEPNSNVPFQRIDKQLRAGYRDVYVTMIEGSPSPDEVFPKVKRPEHQRVVFVPLMITNSEHIVNDVLGDNDKSWKTKLGLPYKLAPSLSQTPAVMEIYFKSLEEVLGRF